jgi:hypothetical protein
LVRPKAFDLLAFRLHADSVKNATARQVVDDDGDVVHPRIDVSGIKQRRAAGPVCRNRRLAPVMKSGLAARVPEPPTMVNVVAGLERPPDGCETLCGEGRAL